MHDCNVLLFNVSQLNLKIELPKSESFTWFVCGDWHGEHLDVPTFTRMIQIAIAKPYSERGLIINGDLYDAPYGFVKDDKFKHWRRIRNAVDDFFIPSFDKETEVVAKILDAVQGIFSKVIFVGGNHDEPRMENIKKIVPFAYKSYFDIQGKLKLKDRGIPFVPYNGWIEIGENFFGITHGIYCGVSAHKKHYMAKPTNVIFSHVHSYQSMPIASDGQTKHVVSTGTMAQLDPDYLKGAPNNWDNNFVTLTLTPDENEYSLTPITVRNKKIVMLDGRVV